MLHQVGYLFELNVKLQCQKVNHSYPVWVSPVIPTHWANGWMDGQTNIPLPIWVHVVKFGGGGDHEAFTANKCKKFSWVISRVKVQLKTSVLGTCSVSMSGINMGNELRHITQSIWSLFLTGALSGMRVDQNNCSRHKKKTYFLRQTVMDSPPFKFTLKDGALIAKTLQVIY